MKTIYIPFEEVKPFLVLPPKAFAFLHLVRFLARNKGYFLYLAGGPVRDFLLKRPVKDLDLVLEGDWKELLPEILKEKGLTLLFQSPFLTYKLKIDEGFTLDLVTARKEIYPEPAHLPRICPSDFKEDIFRRDFTINALIYGLTPPYEETLVDLVSGLADLKKGLIRPLHLKSFVDDPTRAFRGVRYKVRLRFDFAEEIYLALSEADKVSSFKKLSAQRLINELLLFLFKESLEDLPLLLEETKRLKLLNRTGLVLRKISPKDFEILELALIELSRKEAEKFFLLFLVEISEENLKRLGFSEKERLRLLNWWNYFFKEDSFFKLGIIEKVEVLEKLPLYLVFRLALEDTYREFILKFLKELRFVKPEVTGYDLLSMGVKEGETIGKILKELRRRRIEGELRSKEEELSFVKTLIFQSF
ncbi:MAG: hypothetical protein ACP5KO_01660 [Caldimicrobium sp.]